MPAGTPFHVVWPFRGLGLVALLVGEAGDKPLKLHGRRPRNKGSGPRPPAHQTSGRASVLNTATLHLGANRQVNANGQHKDEQSKGPKKETRSGTNHMERPNLRSAR